jgi:radical SAM superfamily enzyme YgiQ (UPF0313 family)
MNIVCVYSLEEGVSLEKPLNGWYNIPYGISYIATVLKQLNQNVRMEVFTSAFRLKRRIRRIVAEFMPEMVCLTAVSSQFPLIVRITEEMKRINPSIFIIVGGAHPSLNPDEAINIKTIDAICIGEGENAVKKVVSQLSERGHISGINNIWVKNGNQIEKNPQDPFIQDLNSIPMIDRELWVPWIANPNPWHRNPSFLHSVLLGRGCPYKCSYCSNHALSNLSRGCYVRFRPIDSVMNEIKNIIEKFPPVEQIFFEIETLGANRKYMDELCFHLEQLNQSLDKPVSFGINFAVCGNAMNHNELLIRLQRANFKYINIGLESGSETIRNEILRRPKYSNEDIISFCKLAKQYSIKVNMYVLAGIPGESREDFQKTIDCIKKCNPNNIFLSILYPYPGTDLYKIVVDKGLLKNSIAQKGERKKVILNLPMYTRFQIKLSQFFAFYKIYHQIWPVSKIILFTVIFCIDFKRSTRILKFLEVFNKKLVDKHLAHYPFF